MSTFYFFEVECQSFLPSSTANGYAQVDWELKDTLCCKTETPEVHFAVISKYDMGTETLGQVYSPDL